MSRKIVITLFLLFVSSYFQTDSKLLNKNYEVNRNIVSANIKSSSSDKNKAQHVIRLEPVSKLNRIQRTNAIEKNDESSMNKTDMLSIHRSRRQKRDLTFNRDADPNNPYTIEVLVVVDESMLKFHRIVGGDITEYILSLMSTAADVFADASVGNMINIAVVDIVKLNKDLNAKGLRGGKDAHNMLDNFKNYMNKIPKKLDYDVGLLLTRENLCSMDGCLTTGLATLGGICTPMSYAIVQDNGLSTGYTIAHELGHLLNADHDDDKDVCSKYLHDQQLHVMASDSHLGVQLWSWSTCSRHFITQYLEGDKGSCLLNKPSKNMLKSHSTYIPNTNRQCQLAYGISSKAILRADQKISCNNMKCQTQNSIYLPYAEGTKCDVGKQCYQGQCINVNKIKRINGGWSQYKITGQCSRSCGGGIQWYTRECNSPTPNNGRYCVGRHSIYKSCNTQDCPTSKVDWREEQCLAMNNRTHRWTAAYNVHSEDRCSLACKNKDTQNVSWLKDKVIDGTPCDQSTSDKCVNGVCRPAGCDNKLNSKLKLNKCGVCHSSYAICKQISESFSANQIGKLNKNKKYQSFFNVVRIPKGAVNVEIIQFGHRGDENYIAFENDQGENIRFGNPFTDPTSAVYIYDGLDFEYTSSKTMVKMATPASTHLQRDLTVKIFLTGEQKGDLIHYSYWIKQ